MVHAFSQLLESSEQQFAVKAATHERSASVGPLLHRLSRGNVRTAGDAILPARLQYPPDRLAESDVAVLTGDSEARRQIRWSDQNGVQARHRGDLLDIRDPLRRLDLNRN